MRIYRRGYKCYGAYPGVTRKIAATQYSTGLWPSSGSNFMAIADIDWSGITEVTLFRAIVKADGTIETTTNNLNTYGAALVSAAHSRGKKAYLLFAQVSAGVFLNQVNTNLTTLVANIVGAMNTYGFDGIDIDWEVFQSGTEGTAMIALISALRAAMGTSLISVSMAISDWSWWATNYSNLSGVTRFNIMSYDMGGTFEPTSWFNAPMYGDSTSYWSVDLAMTRFSTGIPVSKLGIGLALYGYNGTNPAAPRQAWNTPTRTQQAYLTIQPQITAGNYHFDSTGKCPWIDLTTSYTSYDDEVSLKVKILEVRRRGLAGWTIFQIHDDFLPSNTPKHPLIQAIAQAMS